MKLTRKVLHRSTRPVEFEFPWKNKKISHDMLKFMRENDGIGLAANQVGINQKIFVMQAQGWQRECFNPEIVGFSQNLVSWDEGCLSFPGEHCIIVRPEWIDVRYQSADGAWHSERFARILARCYQHELDHLNGLTMWDRHREQNATQC
jgi:peptide deformylase